MGYESLLGAEPSKNHIISKIQDRDMISFDCHAIFDEDDALSSHLELTFPDRKEWITARDFLSLKIPASIISLMHVIPREAV
ncbi:MAG: hypothetical protein M3530_02430 [Thermoproteota archaeon]|nr:hypothetical protein [Thermoproteota archaeon]